MGTFHDGLGELHGMTVVVDTDGPEIAIGRCHEMDERRIVLHDADVHEDGRDALTKADWLRRAVAVGAWPRVKRLVMSMEGVTAVRLLSEISRT